jgi:hypothetical protein
LRRALTSLLVERSWLISACALIAYVALASPYIVDGDSAEFSTLAAVGGRAHPSGYPLYVLWLRAWSWLPGLTPAHTAAIATAILGALAIGVLHAACRAWGARPIAATITAAIIAAAPIVQRYHCEAEAFAMNNLVVALVLWLAAARGPLRGGKRAAMLGLVAGLGLADHLTCVLVAPVGLLGVVRAAREARASAYAVAVLGLALGLLPYGYLLVADGVASWGSVSSLSDVVAMILRREYGGASSFLLEGIDVPWTASVAACFATIARSWLWVLAIGGVAMLGIRIWRPAGETRWAWALLAASFVLAGPVLALQFNIEPTGLGLYVCQRFHILPALLLALPVSALIDLACARISRPAVATALSVLGFVGLTVAGVPALARIHSPALELGVRNLLRSLPPDAIVVVIADDQCFGGRYLQLARGERPDVAFLCAGLLPTRWYRAAWALRGIALPPGTRLRLGAALLTTGRPVFVDPTLTELLASFPSYPFGIVRHVLRPTARPPSAADIALLNRDLYQRFALDYPLPGVHDDYAAIAHHRYAANWAAIAQLLDAAGDRTAALDAFAVTRQLQPVADD